MAASISLIPVKGSPQLLTRTWLVTPSHHYYRAGKINRKMEHLTYSVLTDPPLNQNIRHGPSPYRISNPRSLNTNRMSTPARQSRTFFTSRPTRSKAQSAIPHISLHIAAASSGKQRKYEPEKSTIDFPRGTESAIGLQSAGNLYAKRRSRPDSGEDAYFAASVGGDPDTVAMGVCDGVGGWSEQGINPADFSHGMCAYMAEHALRTRDPQALHPKKLMHVGYDEILADTQVRAGGATACVAVADGSGRIRVANLGDSGFVLLRLGTVHTYSTPQTHAFNTPFQMSKTPPEIMTQAAIFGGLPLNDSPDHADVTDEHLQQGDVVVFATDGVWDNLSAQDVLNIVSKVMRDLGAWKRTDEKVIAVSDHIVDLVKMEQPSRGGEGEGQGKMRSIQSVIASHIVGEAKIASQDRKRDGPFAKAVQREYPMERWHGGKVDDITALVVIAVERNGGGQLKAKL